jgi:hypothetical protein
MHHWTYHLEKRQQNKRKNWKTKSMLQNSHEQSIFAALKPTRARFFLLQRTDNSASKNTPRREKQTDKQTETRSTTIYSSSCLQFPLNFQPPRSHNLANILYCSIFSHRIPNLEALSKPQPKPEILICRFVLSACDSSCDSLLRITISTSQWLCLCFLGSSVASLCFLCSLLFSEETREGR